VSKPILVWHSCGDNYGYRIPWGELMANHIWPWGDDLNTVLPDQDYISLCNRKLIDFYRSQRSDFQGLDDADALLKLELAADGCVGALLIEDYVQHEVIDVPRLIRAIKSKAGVPDGVRVPTWD